MRHGDVARDRPADPERLGLLLAPRAEARGCESLVALAAGVRSVSLDRPIVNWSGSASSALVRASVRAGSPRSARRFRQSTHASGWSSTLTSTFCESTRSARKACRWCGAGSPSAAARERFRSIERSISARAAASRQKKTRWQSTRRPLRRLGCSSDALTSTGMSISARRRHDPLRPGQHPLLQLEPRAGEGVRGRPLGEVGVEVGDREAKRGDVGRRAHEGESGAD